MKIFECFFEFVSDVFFSMRQNQESRFSEFNQFGFKSVSNKQRYQKLKFLIRCMEIQKFGISGSIFIENIVKYYMKRIMQTFLSTSSCII